MSDWGPCSRSLPLCVATNYITRTESDSDSKPSPAAAAKPPAVPKKSKWEGEDEEDDEPVVCVYLPVFSCHGSHFTNSLIGKSPQRKK